MRRQILPVVARSWPKTWYGYRAQTHTIQCPPTRMIRRHFYFYNQGPPKNPIMTTGTPPPPGKPQNFAVIYLLFIPIPRTEILYWVGTKRQETILRSLIIFFEILFLLSFGVAIVKSKETPDPFDLPRFTKFTIVSEETVSSTSKLLTIKPKKPSKEDPYAAYWEKGLWSVEFKQPLLQIARSYTPLPPDENVAKEDLRFLIRKEPNGEMSNYLFGLHANSEVELRGPHVEFDLPKNVEEVVFLAGGTGIAPAMQVVHTLLEARKSNGKRPRIRIIWANRRREDCVEDEMFTDNSGPNKLTSEGAPLIVHQLQKMQQKYPESLHVNYVVDDEGTFIDQRMISQAMQPSFEARSELVAKESDTKLLFVSGPEGFINHFAGQKKWGREQGELGGVLGRMGVRDWKVFKL